MVQGLKFVFQSSLLFQKKIKNPSIEDFGVSVAILPVGANSDQTFIKCCDLACDVESLSLKNCKDLTMTLEVKYLFPTSSSGSNFLYLLVAQRSGNETNISTQD